MAKSACPYCCHPSFDPISPINPPQQGSVDKVHDLHNKIRQLDDTVAQLSKSRAELLEELNAVQSSISILPLEMLSYIFQFVCSPPAFNSFPAKHNFSVGHIEKYEWYNMKLVLSRVSASWRRTVITTPQLWTSVRLRIETVATEDDVDFLHQFFKNSGQLPLTLSLHFSSDAVDEDILFHPSLDALLVENLSRIKNLHLRSPPHAWFSHLPNLGQLTHLSINDVHDHNPPLGLSLSHLSSFSELTLIGRPIKLSSPYLTVLNFLQIPLDDIFHMIVDCPNLTKLSIRKPADIFDEDSSFPVETFILPRLEVLDWTVSNSRNRFNNVWENALLTHFHTPSLRAFSFIQTPLSRYPGTSELQRATTGFFSRLPETLTHLEFVGIMDEPSILVDLVNWNVREDCQIESLEFVDCHFRFLVGILQNMGCSFRFPRLCRITMEKICWPVSYYQSNYVERQQPEEEPSTLLAHTCFEMVEKRLHEPKRPLALYMACGGTDVEWLDCIKLELTELKQRGRQLDIFVGSTLVI